MKRLLAVLALAGMMSHAWGQTFPGTVEPQVIAVNQFPFNATCDGVTNDQVPIQNALNAVTASGGTVLFPSGKICKVNSSLTIGNGNAAGASTNNGIVLDCASNPLSTSYFGGMSGTGGCRILWGGSGATGVINVFGPYQGLSIRNLFIDCNSTAASIGLNMISVLGADIHNDVFNNCFQGIAMSTVPQGGIFGDSNTEANHFDNNIISVANLSNAIGVFLTGQVTDTTSVSYANVFTNTKILFPLVATTMLGIDLQRADSNQFYNTIMFGGGAGCTAVVFDYSSANTIPTSNVFFGIDPGPNHCTGSFANVGTPNASDKPNYIYGLVETNGGTCANLANLACFQSGKMILSPGGTGVNVTINPVPITIASLPTCNASTLASRYTVSNGQTTPTYLGTVSTTGAVTASVFCNGTNWVYD